MRRIENQGLRYAEMRQVLTTPHPDREVPVKHSQRQACARCPHWTTNPGGTGDQVAVTSIQHRNAAAPTGRNGPQVEGRMPAWHNDHVRPRLCDRFRDRSHVDAPKALRVEAAARCRRLKNTMRIPVGKTDIPLEGLTET